MYFEGRVTKPYRFIGWSGDSWPQKWVSARRRDRKKTIDFRG